MHPHEQTIRDFYGAFIRKDGEAMARCYAPNVQFRDPIFELHGDRAAWMWRMFCANRGLEVLLLDAYGDDRGGRATWEAQYRFSATGRPVTNRITSRFEFDREGKILRHEDSFSFAAWAGQAFGFVGKLAPAPLLKLIVRASGERAIASFAKKHGVRAR